jgi:hypothetical protein
MNSVRSMIYTVGSRLGIVTILVLIVALNASWLATLNAFGAHFEQVSGYPLIDLQNTSSILSASAAVGQIATYSSDARSLYWSFFILDNIMPPLTFGALALLWAYYLSRGRGGLVARLKNSPFLLIPFGVGLFDWMENLVFVTVVADPAAAGALQMMEIGLIFTRLKAGFLFATFGLTLALTVYHIVTQIRYRRGDMTGRRAATAA